MKSWIYLLPFVAGVAMATQAAVNSQPRTPINNPLVAVLISFIIGTVTIGLMVIVTQSEIPALLQLRTVEWYQYAGGLLGVFFVTVIIFPYHAWGQLTRLLCLLQGSLLQHCFMTTSGC